MTLHRGLFADPAVVAPEREAEMLHVVDRLTRWAESCSDAVGLLLAGSCARGAAGPDSDVDLLLLSTDPGRYAAGDTWRGEPWLGEAVRTRAWGPVTEWRYVTASGLEVEVGVAATDWARTDPVDDGTRRVVTDGVRALHDPAGILGRLIRACG